MTPHAPHHSAQETRTRTSKSEVDRLWAAFTRPPRAARPRFWWHWMDGNIETAGVRKDLEWMARIGVGGVQLFFGGLERRRHLPDPVTVGSPTWREALAEAARACLDLDLELSVATSAGWSASGAPWVRAQDAMRKLVWSETVVESTLDGEAGAIPLVALPSTTGPYQDMAQMGREGLDARCGGDSFVVAFPDRRPFTPLVWDRAIAGRPPVAGRTGGSGAASAPGSFDALSDGRFDSWIELPRDPEGDTAWIEVRFAEPVDVRAVTVGVPAPSGFGAAPPPGVTLTARTETGDMVDVVDLPASAAAVRSRSFAAVRSDTFRLVLTGRPAAEGLPALSEDLAVTGPPVRACDFRVSELRLWADGRVSAAEEKAGFWPAPDYYALDTPPEAVDEAIDPEEVVDLTGRLRADGSLDWRPPPGRWRILRFGWSLTGATNGPALPEDTGLEVDKLDPDRVRSYLERWLDEITDAMGDCSDALRGVLSDSIEAGQQNWTDRFRADLEDRTGYSLAPWAPALAGYVVGSAEESDRVLWDVRDTIAAGYARYYETLADVAHRRGLVLYAEALEDRRPQLGDDMTMRAPADIPMGAMWMHDPAEGPAPTYVADCKGASSVAHVHGRAAAGCESMTAWGRPWDFLPADLKPIADREFLLGITRVCLHTSPHQPDGVAPPGVAMASLLGQYLTRHETWADQAGPFVDYLARCSALLGVGRPTGRVGVVYGQEAPLTGLYGADVDHTVPRGVDVDYVDVGALSLLSTRRGKVVTPGGARYDLLVLAGSSGRLTTATLRRLDRLTGAGATLVGDLPTTTPSRCDAREHSRLVDRIRSRQVAAGEGVEDALGRLGVIGWTSTDPCIDVVSREVADVAVHFVASRADRRTEVDLALPYARGGAVVELWDPVTLERGAVPSVRDDLGRVGVRLDLPPHGSTFVVLAPSADAALSDESGHDRRRPPTRRWVELSVELDAAADPTSTDPEVLTYRTHLPHTSDPDGPARPDRLLDLGRVEGVAEVFLDRRPCGVAWAWPYRVRVPSEARAGAEVTIEVRTTWRNALVARAGQGSDSPYRRDAPRREAGIRGPVRLLVDPGPPGGIDGVHTT